MFSHTLNIEYKDPQELFAKIYTNYKYKFLLESKDISEIYGRMSLIGVDPCLKITGKNDEFHITILNKNGEKYLKEITNYDLKICDKFKKTTNKINGIITKEKILFEESERSKRKNISNIIRLLLKKFHNPRIEYLGLYGAFSYDFIRLFEDIDSRLDDNDVNDFTLFLYDTFIFFDHLKQKASIIVYRDSESETKKVSDRLLKLIENTEERKSIFKINSAKFTLSEKEYKKLVSKARKYAKEGELFEVVFSNILKADFKGDSFALYKEYSKANPSPYLFYFDFGDEQLVGASPEMMVRCENGIVNLRPISGTAKRGEDPIKDHENMLDLLKNEKERAELDMLIDLGRNDLARICEPGIKISDYRFVEKYSKVMHTVAHLTGKLKENFIALDALISCINAGTVTGAPKIAAMQMIEDFENERRGYYGGTIGYLTFSGNMDTGIIIRTAHIKNSKLKFQVGATLLYDSKPQYEYQETLHKASAFLNITNI